MVAAAAVAAAAGLGCTSPSGAALERPLALGDASLAVGQPEQAVLHYREALLLEPGNPPALLGLARAELAADRPERAIAALDELELREPAALASDPGVVCRARRAAVRQRRQASDWNGVLRTAADHRTAGCDPARTAAAQATAWLAIGEQARLAGRAEEAIQAFEAGLEADPSRVTGFVGAAELLLSEGRRTDAVALLGRALELHPDDPRLLELMVAALAALPSAGG